MIIIDHSGPLRDFKFMRGCMLALFMRAAAKKHERPSAFLGGESMSNVAW